MATYTEADVNVVCAVSIEPQQTVRLVSLEPDVEFFVPVATVITVVQLTDVVHNPRGSVEAQPAFPRWRHRRRRGRGCDAVRLTNSIHCTITTDVIKSILQEQEPDSNI